MKEFYIPRNEVQLHDVKKSATLYGFSADKGVAFLEDRKHSTYYQVNLTSRLTSESTETFWRGTRSALDLDSFTKHMYRKWKSEVMRMEDWIKKDLRVDHLVLNKYKKYLSSEDEARKEIRRLWEQINYEVQAPVMKDGYLVRFVKCLITAPPNAQNIVQGLQQRYEVPKFKVVPDRTVGWHVEDGSGSIKDIPWVFNLLLRAPERVDT